MAVREKSQDGLHDRRRRGDGQQEPGHPDVAVAGSLTLRETVEIWRSLTVRPHPTHEVEGDRVTYESRQLQSGLSQLLDWANTAACDWPNDRLCGAILGYRALGATGHI